MKTKPKAKSTSSLVGREKETDQITRALGLNRNILIEGPVGVGKTFLVQQILRKLGRGFERVDGDSRYSEQKLTGWFDPPLVLKKGYTKDCFIEGPLLLAMQQGTVLFINELNRMPEAVQNILLPAMDEHTIVLPKLGTVTAKEGFAVVATQNPREFTATHALSEALLDRFEMIRLEYQSLEEESEILKKEVSASTDPELVRTIVQLIRATRQHPAIKRGASVRAGLAVVKLMEAGIDHEDACLMALPSRIEMVSSDEDPREIIRQLIASGGHFEKKKAPKQ